MSIERDEMPCLPENIDIDKFNGVPCWNIGWGTDQLGDSYSRTMKSIGLNLMSQNYCTAHSFWEVEDGHLCGGLPPNDTTPIMGWKHVTAGGKEACHGDYGAPLVCDINGKATLIGVHSFGDLTECGLAGRPAIHTEVEQAKESFQFHAYSMALSSNQNLVSEALSINLKTKLSIGLTT